MSRKTALALLIAALQAIAAEYRLDVPFIRQDREGCGAAATAMVMRYWIAQGAPIDSRAADPDVIQNLLYQPAAQGIYGSAMRDYLEQHGFSAYAIAPAFADLEHHLSRGRPLIVCLQPKAGAPLHYVVLTGIDTGEVIFNDPARGPALRQKTAAFQKAWSAKGNWTLLAVPKS